MEEPEFSFALFDCTLGASRTSFGFEARSSEATGFASSEATRFTSFGALGAAICFKILKQIRGSEATSSTSFVIAAKNSKRSSKLQLQQLRSFGRSHVLQNSEQSSEATSFTASELVAVSIASKFRAKLQRHRSTSCGASGEATSSFSSFRVLGEATCFKIPGEAPQPLASLVSEFRTKVLASGHH